MWFLPILVVGAIAMAVASRSSRKAAPPSRQLPAGPPGMPGPIPVGPPGTPGPISVLGEILRVGQTPPPTVILCAIAEAQAIGRNDLASDIVSVFIAPVVYHHQRTRGSRPVQATYERGSCEISRSPRHAAESAHSPPTAPPRFEAGFPAAWSPPPPVVPRAEAPAAPSDFAPPLGQPSMSSSMSMDDEITALLNADPVRFMEMVSRGTLPSTGPAPHAASAIPAPAVPQQETPSMDPITQPTGLVPETVAQMQEAAGLPEAADRTRALAPGSPIPAVPDAAWRDFVVLLAREEPQFSSSRHVGQYRHRRERLAELGINPAAIVGSAQAQRIALDADLADAHQHGVAGELFVQHLGRPIALPGREGTKTITLSGALGVIQCAGLEGAVGWLERPNDRKRYPHTTQAFERTNGVF